MMRLFHILLISITLYPRIGLAGIAEEINSLNVDSELKLKFLVYDRSMSPFQIFDYNYNQAITNADKRSLKQAENYAKKFLKKNHNIADKKKWPIARDEMIYHYLYFSSTLKHLHPQDEDQTKIYINILLMMNAYDAAMDFRVCVLCYSTSYPNYAHERIKLCQEMFEYMEWFFLFMKDEKLKGLCEIDTYPQLEECTPPSTAQFTAKDLCERLKNVNLNFLKTQDEVKHIPPLKNDPYNIFKPDVLNATNPKTHELYFKPLFPDGVVKELLGRFPHDVYQLIISRINYSYTQEFSNIRRYFRAVYTHVPFDDYFHVDPGQEKDFQYKISIWNNIKSYKRITEKAVKTPRQVSYKLGDTILRSNAVDVLRLRIVQDFWIHFGNLSKYDNIHNATHSEDTMYYLTCAPKNIGTDYYYTTFNIEYDTTFDIKDDINSE